MWLSAWNVLYLLTADTSLGYVQRVQRGPSRAALYFQVLWRVKTATFEAWWAWRRCGRQCRTTQAPPPLTFTFSSCSSCLLRTQLCRMCFNFSHASVQSLGLPAASCDSPPLLLHVLPKTSALHCCDPITLSRLQTDTKNITLWENASFPVCCPSLYIFITRCGLQENWFAATTAHRVTTQQFALCARPSLTYPTCCCASACVCVGCTEENKGFAGIMPLQQTKGCSKLGVAPSDTWSGLNLGAAQSGVEGWRGHCFRVIIFKSPGRAGPRVFSVQFIPSCFAGWLQEFDKRSFKLCGDCVCGVRACTSVRLFFSLRWLASAQTFCSLCNSRDQRVSVIWISSRWEWLEAEGVFMRQIIHPLSLWEF